jgi:hypothetical protein
MFAHRMKILIPENHEVTLQLPHELPSGAAEVIVLSDLSDSTLRSSNINAWLAGLAAGVPESPVLPLDALRRENLYE